MMAKFVGGSWDGQTRETKGARYVIVPLPERNTSNGDEFRYLEMRDGMPYRKPPEFKLQHYKREAVRDDDGRTTGYQYRLEPEAP